MSSYFFLTEWRVGAPIERVWDAIYNAEEWPQWWGAVESVAALEPGEDTGVGTVRHFVWRGRLPYQLSFTMRTMIVRRPNLLEGEARGELEGTGRWELSPIDGGTKVRYTWGVRTNKWWMNTLAPLLKPLFHWNHDYVMRQGGEGLAKRLGASLLGP